MPTQESDTNKMDQIAYASRSDADTYSIKEALGLLEAEWVEDFVVARGTVHGKEGLNRAKLLFNYDLGVEIEILQYLAGPNYVDGLPLNEHGYDTWNLSHVESGNLCHIGIHAGKDVPTFDFPVVQQVETVSHTNEYVNSRRRRYRYTIYDTKSIFGHYLKVIERIQDPSLITDTSDIGGIA